MKENLLNHRLVGILLDDLITMMIGLSKRILVKKRSIMSKITIPSKFKSRKLWVLIVFAIFEVFNQEFGWNFEMANVRWLAVTYLAGQSFVDYSNNGKK